MNEVFDLALERENILTQGIDLHQLPCGSRLRIGADAVVVVHGLRNPCRQLNAFRDGLLEAVMYRDKQGVLVRKAGVMATVQCSGQITAGDEIRIELPEGQFEALQPV